MKKFIMLGLMAFSMFAMAQPYRDERGVLVMSEDEWIQFYNKDGQDVALCPVIGSLIMEESYIRDGKRMGNTLAELQKLTKELNDAIASTGLRDINGGTSRLHEFYYAAVCRKPSQQEYDMVGSPTFRREMNRIFETHKNLD